MRARLGWSLIAACLVAAACGGQSSSNVGDAGDGADAGDAGTLRVCPMLIPNSGASKIVPGTACTVDPTVTCTGPFGPAACPACEFVPLPCKCASEAWACDDQGTLQCNLQCFPDASVSPKDASVEADAADAD